MRGAEVVEELLRRSGLTKSEFSARSGVSRSQIDDYLKGRSQPSLAQVVRLGESVGLVADIVWTPRPEFAEQRHDVEPTKSPDDKARVLEIVVAMAWELPSKPRGDLVYPSLRRLADERESTLRS